MASIGIPIAGSFETAGTAGLETLPQEVFEWTGANAIFAGSMTVDEFKNAFLLSEPAQDASASVNVSMDASGAADFMAALLNAMDGAAKYVSGDDSAMVAGSSTLQEYLQSRAQSDLTADISENGIAGNIEAEALTDALLTDFAEDASGGINQLWDDMVAQNNAPKLNIIARQLSASRYLTEVGETFSDRLPVLAGDEITFRFVISQTYEVSALRASATGEATGAVTYPITAPTVTYGVGALAIDLKLTLTQA